MEASLVARVELRDSDHRDFVQVMLGNDQERPLFEDEVPKGQRGWFAALEELPFADDVEPVGESALYTSWTLGGAEWDEDAKDIFSVFRRIGAKDVFAVIAGDEGWYELWVMQKGKCQLHRQWNGMELEELFDVEMDLGLVLERIRADFVEHGLGKR